MKNGASACRTSSGKMPLIDSSPAPARATIFLDWLRIYFPDRAGRVEALIREMHGGRLYGARSGDRMRGTCQSPLATQIAGTFKVFAARYGLNRKLPSPSSAAFRRPGDAAQMRLFDAA